jgi:hypothetical protein
MGAADPAVEARYGPSTNAPAALEGVDLPELDDPSEDGSVRSVPITANGPPKGKLVKVSRGKGPSSHSHLLSSLAVPRRSPRVGLCLCPSRLSPISPLAPKEWAEADPSVRSTAIVLTFRHFVRVSAQSGSLSHAKPDPLIAATAPRRGHHVPLLLPFLSQRYWPCTHLCLFPRAELFGPLVHTLLPWPQFARVLPATDAGLFPG